MDMMQQLEETDGRRQRSEASRERIVKAMLELVGAGDVSPGAENVAARARVGLRTVFRHFENMESLYQEINAKVEAEIRPILNKPFAARDAKSRIAELLDRRVRIFERIMPFKIAGDVHRHHSAFLATQAQRFTREQRAGIVDLLPERTRNGSVLESLDLLLSFETWRRLRKEQKLSVPRARQVVERLVHGLLSER